MRSSNKPSNGHDKKRVLCYSPLHRNVLKSKSIDFSGTRTGVMLKQSSKAEGISSKLCFPKKCKTSDTSQSFRMVSCLMKCRGKALTATATNALHVVGNSEHL
jgi:hypothetical protein